MNKEERYKKFHELAPKLLRDLGLTQITADVDRVMFGQGYQAESDDKVYTVMWKWKNTT